MNICVITDNSYIYEKFVELCESKGLSDLFNYFYSEGNEEFEEKYGMSGSISSVSLETSDLDYFKQYDLIISLHCRQIFPEWLVKNIRCVNVHPGYNPYNRGMYPHIFSIINGLPTGVTIHEMDARIDHGSVICQQEVEIVSHDTAFTVYEKILKLEIEMLDKNLNDIISGNYVAKKHKEVGNINYKSDFKDLCRLNLDDQASLKDHLKLLRALTYPGSRNAYFEDNGKRVFIELNILDVVDGEKT